MKERSFVDLCCGAVACLSLLGLFAIIRDVETAALEERRRRRGARPLRRAEPIREFVTAPQRRRSSEDDCRHCGGSGECGDCAPGVCRVCHGRGVQPPDETLIPRLERLWGGAA